DSGRPISDEALRDYCDRNYHQILPIIAENVHQEKVQQKKLKAVKARLNFEDTLRHSKSGTLSKRRGLKERLGHRHARSMSGSLEPRRDRSKPPRERGPERKTVFKRLEKGVFHRLGDKEKSVSEYSRDSRHRSYNNIPRDTESCYRSSRSRETEFASKKHHNKRTSSRRTKELLESEDHVTPRIRYFDFSKTRIPSHIKTYDGREDPEDHLKIFQAATKTERWVMPTWCHMFNSTLTGNVRVWFDDLPKESIDSYDDLKEAFLENYLQQKNASKIQLKFTISSNETGNPRKISKAIAFDQRNKAKWWKRPDKGGKKWENLRKGETVGNTDGEEDGMEGPMIIEAEMGGHFVHRISLKIPYNMTEQRDEPIKEQSKEFQPFRSTSFKEMSQSRSNQRNSSQSLY
nr:reverse transcriptase domain-containing protein [Tanacetum cinerariifolium]